MSVRGGKLARLATLEDRARTRAARVEAVKVEQARRVWELLSAQDQATLGEMLTAQKDMPAWWAEVMAAGAAVRNDPLPHPFGVAARAWCAVVNVPPGIPAPRPADPSGFAAYLEAEAGRCEQARDMVREGAPLPDGVRGDTLDTCARWCAVEWRFYAALCRVLGGEA